MRIAVLSDIHGNLPALEAVLAELKPYDVIWQLGDICGYGPLPNEVVALLAAEGAIGVRGNHDSAAIGQLETDSFNDDARAAVEWTAGVLTADTHRWLSALPLKMVDGSFTMVHGSPRDPTWEYIFTAETARANMKRFQTSYCLVGHTHVPFVFVQGKSGGVDAVIAGEDSVLDLDGTRIIVNPGSVGQPRDGDPRASAMIIDTEASTIAWHRVEYPIEKTQRLMTDLKLPKRLIQRLEYGL